MRIEAIGLHTRNDKKSRRHWRICIMLNIENINVYYGAIHAVKDISFYVGDGEIVTLIGANGAGKSTILKTISGLLRSHSGSITFTGKNISALAPHKIVGHGLAMVPEGRAIFLQMSVEENLEMGAFTRPNGELNARLDRVFTHFPRLKERRRQQAGTLSGGEQQMLATGRSLMSDPKLLMLDEPSMGLAPILVEQIFDIIRELNKSGTTILLVEQNAQMALSIANRGYVLETGSIIKSAPASELLEDDDVKKAYLGG
jgi:branched-chain amino acid transport system ATP-binding protein